MKTSTPVAALNGSSSTCITWTEAPSCAASRHAYRTAATEAGLRSVGARMVLIMIRSPGHVQCNPQASETDDCFTWFRSRWRTHLRKNPHAARKRSRRRRRVDEQNATESLQDARCRPGLD